MVHDALRGLPASQDLEPQGPKVVEIARIAHVAQAREAADVIAEASEVAAELRKVVDERGWVQVYGQREVGKDSRGRKITKPIEHLTIEAWQFIARFFAVTVRVASCEFVEIAGDHGFKAVAEAINANTGDVLSRAESFCMTDEARWKERAKYEWVGKWPNRERKLAGTEPVSHRERAGMAQTRACSRALANLFRAVAGMAGYDGTPADDLPEAEPIPEEPPPPPVEEPRARDGAGVPRISREQVNDLWALAGEMHGDKRNAVVRAILDEHGYKGSGDIEASRYVEVMQRIERAGRR